MLMYVFLLGLVGVSTAHVYSSNLKDSVDAELALVEAVYGDQLNEIYLGDFSTEDFTLKNVRMRGLNRTKAMGPCTLYVNTDYLVAIAQSFIGVEDAEFLVEEFSAPYLFYEGNETLRNVKFSVKKASMNFHEAVHFNLPKTCTINWGCEIMELDGSTLYSSEEKFNGKDVTPFVHYTVRLALNEYLAKHVVNIPPNQDCLPSVHPTNSIHKYLSMFLQ